MLPLYHLGLHKTQKDFPDLKIACDANDTYLGARPAVLYPGYAALRKDTRRSCGTRSKLAKVVASTSKAYELYPGNSEWQGLI